VVSFKCLGVPIGADGIVVNEMLTDNIKKAKKASRYMSMLGVSALGFTPYRNAFAWKSFVHPCSCNGWTSRSMQHSRKPLAANLARRRLQSRDSAWWTPLKFGFRICNYGG